MAHLFSRKGRAGIAMPDLDQFGEQVQRSERVSNAGRSRLPLRIVISLLNPKHAYNESDEGVVQRWGETPTWQFFGGQLYFEHRRPCDATTLGKLAIELKLIKPQELTRVVVSSAVQRKTGGYAHA